MALLLSIGTAVPPHEVTREVAATVCRRVYADEPAHARVVASLLEQGGIERRRLALPLEDVLRRRSIAETAAAYARESVALAKAAARSALDRAGRLADEVSVVVLTSATGFMIPSADTYVIDALGIDPGVRRVPVGQLGCLGGVAGVALAADLLDARARDRGVGLVVSVELPSLSFRADARRMDDLVAATLFGDGAAAAVLAAGDGDGRRGATGPLRILGSRSYLFRDSREMAAFRLGDRGFEVILNREIPWFAAARMQALCDELLGPLQRRRSDLSFFAFHPGGRRVIEEAARALGAPPSALWASWKVLREHGNMSSPSALFVLDEIMRATGPGAACPASGDAGLLAAFGPGFSAELVALEGAT